MTCSWCPLFPFLAPSLFPSPPPGVTYLLRSVSFHPSPHHTATPHLLCSSLSPSLICCHLFSHQQSRSYLPISFTHPFGALNQVLLLNYFLNISPHTPPPDFKFLQDRSKATFVFLRRPSQVSIACFLCQPKEG